MPQQPIVGWIGAGRMGVPMAGFLLKAGYPVIAWSPSPASRQRLVALGAREARSVAECAGESAMVFSCITEDSALRTVALGPQGVLAHLKPGSVYADTSTVSVAASAEVADAANAAGIKYLRLPISGNAASAATGNVTALVSGPEDAWTTLRPLVETFSSAQIYLGPAEEARLMKLVVNALVINFAQAMAEALTLGRKGGLDWTLMLDTLAQSTLSSPWLKAKAALMKARDFSPTMTGRLILKDVDLMLGAARESDVPMPLTALTRQLLQMMVGEGHGDEDYMALIKLAENQAGLSSARTD